MNRTIIRGIAQIVVFIAVALLLFTENVRTVQVLGLMACGAVIGSALTSIIRSIRSKETEAK